MDNNGHEGHLPNDFHSVFGRFGVRGRPPRSARRGRRPPALRGRLAGGFAGRRSPAVAQSASGGGGHPTGSSLGGPLSLRPQRHEGRLPLPDVVPGRRPLAAPPLGLRRERRRRPLGQAGTEPHRVQGLQKKTTWSGRFPGASAPLSPSSRTPTRRLRRTSATSPSAPERSRAPATTGPSFTAWPLPTGFDGA